MPVSKDLAAHGPNRFLVERAGARVMADDHRRLLPLAQRPHERQHLLGIAVRDDEEGDHGGAVRTSVAGAGFEPA